MAKLSKQDRAEMHQHATQCASVLKRYDKHMEPYDEIDNLDHHLRLVVALLENND